MIDAREQGSGKELQPPAVAQDTVGRASWEDPCLPFRQRLHKYWRQMLVHVWGPAGSVAFHVVALGLLVAFVVRPRNIPVPEPPPIIVRDPTTPPVLDPTAPVPPPDAPKPIQPDPPNASDFHGLAIRDADGPNSPTQGSTIPVEGPDVPTVAPLPLDPVARSPLVRNGLYQTRHGSDRAAALKTYDCGPGGAKATETAVQNALRWLKREQQTDGSWKGTSIPAMTSLALLTYLAHGETPAPGEFGATVKKAIEWLIADQEADGHFKGRDGNDYTQPIAAYALCEAYGMTQHPAAREAARKAVVLVVKGQKAAGTFNYKLETATDRNDTSYMAWCCQALKAAKMAGLEADVPGLEMAIKKAVMGLKLNADPNGGFGYVGRGHTGLSGAGALCLQLFGATRAPEVKATLAFLAPTTCSFANWDKQPYDANASPLYYWYYITQAKFQDSQETFKTWNAQFAPELCRRQIIEKAALAGADGKRADVGHWESPAKSEHTGGVVQDTCLCTLMLEVYYRYLPSFKEVVAAPDVMAAAPKSGDVTVKVR